MCGAQLPAAAPGSDAGSEEEGGGDGHAEFADTRADLLEELVSVHQALLQPGDASWAGTDALLAALLHYKVPAEAMQVS